MTLMNKVQQLRTTEYYTQMSKSERLLADAVSHKQDESQFSYMQEEIINEAYDRYCN